MGVALSVERVQFNISKVTYVGNSVLRKIFQHSRSDFSGLSNVIPKTT